MGRLIRFKEHGARYSRVDLESGDPVWISVAQAGVIVRRSRLGLFGGKIYAQTHLPQVVAHCRHLDALMLRSAEPVSDPVLAPFTAAALSARNLASLQAVFAVPPLIESSYMSAPHFAELHRFVNQHGAFMERAGKWTFGYSEDLLPLPAATIAEMLVVYARAGLARNALSADVRFLIRFAYGQLALALPDHQGAEAATVSERMLQGEFDQNPMWDRVRAAIPTVLGQQTAREAEFDTRLPETS